MSKYSCFNIKTKDHICSLVLNRPNELNTMTRDFWVELGDALEEINRDSDIRVVILSSTGKHFCAGMDLSAFSNGVDDIPDSKMREMAYTGRRMLADEAKDSGLVGEIYETQDEMLDAVHKLAAEIASKSPVAIYGLKAVMNYSRDHNVSDSLDFNALWSGAMLSQADMTEAMTAQMEKRDASFDKMVDVKKFNESKS